MVLVARPLLRLGLLAVGSLLAAGCKPTLDDSSTLVSSPRVLAVRATPAEASPGDDVTLSALYVDASGVRTEGALDWALCTARKPLTELGPVSPSCLVAAADWLIPLGTGLAASATLPKEACRDFGPDTPATKAGEPPGRSVDPDRTGGYYQPVRLMLPEGVPPPFVATEIRLVCGLPGASQEDLALYQRRRRINENPALALIEASIDGVTQSVPDAGAVTVRPGARIELTASWADCPTVPACGDGVCSADEDAMQCAGDCMAPKGCPGSEQFGSFDPTTRTNVLRREQIRLSWLATAGAFDAPHTGRSADEPTPANSSNGFTAPDTSGKVTVWIVVRDDRGGVGWRSFAVIVS